MRTHHYLKTDRVRHALAQNLNALRVVTPVEYRQSFFHGVRSGLDDMAIAFDAHLGVDEMLEQARQDAHQNFLDHIADQHDDLLDWRWSQGSIE